MKTKEEIETSITRSIIDKPEMLKYVTSVPYGFNKPNYEAMSLMVYGYNQCQKDNSDKKYTEEELIEFIWAYKNAVNKDEFINTDKWIENNIESLNKQG